jgi:hypothetical protein
MALDPARAHQRTTLRLAAVDDAFTRWQSARAQVGRSWLIFALGRSRSHLTQLIVKLCFERVCIVHHR